MKIPLKWLKEYIELPTKSSDLAHALTMSGTEVGLISRKGNSDVFEVEITTNRPDCLSLMGIANEVSAITGKKVKKQNADDIAPSSKERLPLQIEIGDKKGCPRYLGRVFDHVQVGGSPSWLVQNLEGMEQKTINNVVDITNFCLFEIGQPLHAFDYDKIKGSKIIVRRAKKGEKIVGINDEEYTLDERILVIADAERPVAIAGIMGGKETQVTSATKRVLLESAQFDPILVRRASRTLRLFSESSYRFERTIDPGKVKTASNRAGRLFMKLTSARVVSKLVEAGVWKSPKTKWIRLRLRCLEETLGVAVRPEKIKNILTSLGFKTKRTKSEIKVKSVWNRNDIKQEADLIEEVTRIYGYHRIPVRLPQTRHDQLFDDGGTAFAQVRKLKAFLVSQGMFEAVSFSLISKKLLDTMGLFSDKCVKVKNPLSLEQEYLRPSGVSGMLDAISHNANRKEKNLAFFEVSKRFLEKKEENVLSLAITGEVQSSWNFKQSSSFYYLKGMVQNCFDVLEREPGTWQEEDSSERCFSDTIIMKNGADVLAQCSTLDASVLDHWDIPQDVYFAEINLDALLKSAKRSKAYHEILKHPPARRDVSFFVDRTISAKQIQDAIYEAGKPFLNDVTLFDEFKGSTVPKGKRSLAFSLEYQKPDGTFTEEEIRSLHEKVGQSLKSHFQAELR